MKHLAQIGFPKARVAGARIYQRLLLAFMSSGRTSVRRQRMLGAVIYVSWFWQVRS
jgi:hypothetical protein